MLQNTPKSIRKTEVKKVILPPLKKTQIIKQNSFKSNSSQNSKSPTISTVPSSQLIKSTKRIIEAPKFQHSNRRQTFSTLDAEKGSKPLGQNKGKSMTKILPSIEKTEKVPFMRRTLISTTFRGSMKNEKSKLLSDYEIQQQTITRLVLKLTGFSMGERGFNMELQQMVEKIDNNSLIHLVIQGDKECKLKDSGIAQLIFNFQKNGRRIIGLELLLNWNDITDIGAKHIGNGLTYLPNLRSLKLNLGHNKFGSKSANCLTTGIRSLTYLKHLEIDVTNYGYENKMEDEGVILLIQSIGALFQLRTLKLIILGQQITLLAFDSLIKSLSNKQKLVSLEIEKDFGMNEEYIGIPGSKFQQLLDTCPTLVNLKISRLSFSKNTKQVRSQFFCKLFKQSYLNNVSIQYTNGYNFMNEDQNYLDFKRQCQERKQASLHLIGYKKLMAQYFENSQRLIDDLYDVQDKYSSLNNSLFDDNDEMLEYYDTFK